MRAKARLLLCSLLAFGAASVSAAPVVIQGVPRLGWGIGRDCMHVAALQAALEAMDCPMSYEEMLVASGRAFSQAWWPGRYGYISCAVAPEDLLLNGAEAAGAKAERVSFPTTDAAWKAVCASIDEGRPVVAWRDCGAQVICGYDPEGRKMHVEEYFDKSGQYQVVDFETPAAPWPLEHPNEVVLLEYDRNTRPPELDWPVILQRAVKFADWPADQKLHGIFVFGLAAYDSWAQTLRAGLGHETAEEAMGLTLSTLEMGADSRAAASVVLADNATVHDAFADAAVYYMAEAEILNAIRPALSGHFVGPWGEERKAMIESFPRQDVRDEAALLVEQAKEQEMLAVDALRVALRDLGSAETAETEVEGDPEQHCRRGRQLKEQRRYAQAAEEFRAAIKLDPGHVDAHWGLAWVLIELDDRQAAAATFRKVIELAPASDKAAEARKALARLGG